MITLRYIKRSRSRTINSPTLSVAAALLFGLLANLVSLTDALAADTGFGTTSLDRTYLGPWQTHFVSAGNTFSCANGSYTCGISNEGTLGYLLNEPRANTVAIYNCYEGTFDFFLSRDAACEGRSRWNPTQAEGYIYTAPPNDGNAVDALYRCRRAINGHLDHFATTLANCEGAILEGPLGYVKHNPQFAPLPQDPTTASTVALNRYYNDNSTYGGNHWVTTGPVTPDFYPEGPVAHLLKSPLQGTVPLYGCYARQQIPGDSDHDGNIDDDDFYNHDDHFVSQDVNCEGWKPDNTLGSQYLHMLGFVYQQPIQGATVPIYRCHRTGDHYVTQAANCEGAGASEGILGYALPSAVVIAMTEVSDDNNTGNKADKVATPYQINRLATVYIKDQHKGVQIGYLCTYGESEAWTLPVRANITLLLDLRFNDVEASAGYNNSLSPVTARTTCVKAPYYARLKLFVTEYADFGTTIVRVPEYGGARLAVTGRAPPSETQPGNPPDLTLQ